MRACRLFRCLPLSCARCSVRHVCSRPIYVLLCLCLLSAQSYSAHKERTSQTFHAPSSCVLTLPTPHWTFPGIDFPPLMPLMSQFPHVNSEQNLRTTPAQLAPIGGRRGRMSSALTPNFEGLQRPLCHMVSFPSMPSKQAPRHTPFHSLSATLPPLSPPLRPQ